jgi:hypothetical protein
MTKIKTFKKAQLDKMRPRYWYFDVAPNATMKVKQATQEDIDRCRLSDDRSKNPNDYWVEDVENNRGALIFKGHCEVITR